MKPSTIIAEALDHEQRQRTLGIEAGVRPNVRYDYIHSKPTFRYSSVLDIAWRVFAYLCVGALAFASGYGLMALIVRWW